MRQSIRKHKWFQLVIGVITTLLPYGTGYAQVTSDSVPLKPILPLESAEGDEAEREIVITPQLNHSYPFPLLIRAETHQQTATNVEDYVPATYTITFPAGKLTSGLPRPEASNDPITRLVNIEEGFGVDMLADITRPTSLAIAYHQPGFEDGLYVAQTIHNNDATSDKIFHVSFDGSTIEPFVTLLPEADPTGLEFSHQDSPFAPGLYVSSNNRDGGRPGDWGGTIQRIDAEKSVVDFTGIGTPSGPGEPGEIAFGPFGWMKDLLLAVNSVGRPADLLNIAFDGDLEPLLNDGLFDQSNAGLAFRSLAIPPEDSLYGDWIYLGEFGRECLCIKRWHPERGLESFTHDLEGAPHGMIFTSGQVFGDSLYVAIDLGNEGKLLRIDTQGHVSEFISGLQGFLYGNGKDVLEFDHDNELLYLSDYYGHRIYRIGKEEAPIRFSILGDTIPELDETFLIDFTMGEPEYSYQVPVTILNDDGDTPTPEPEPEPEPIPEPQPDPDPSPDPGLPPVIPPVNQPSLQMAFETPLDHQSFDMDFTQAPAFATIPIQLKLEGTDSKPTINVFANDELIQTFTSAPYAFQWEVEQIGEYLLTAKAKDKDEHEATATPIRIQVVQSSGNIFIIESNQDLQSEHMRRALFEMGLNGLSVHPSSVSSKLLSKADLVIWKHSLQDAEEHPALAPTLLNARVAGVPLYILTDIPVGSVISRLTPPPSWTELTGIPLLDTRQPLNQPLLPVTETGHNFLSGQYGTVSQIEPKTGIYQTSSTPPFETGIYRSGPNNLVMAAKDPLNTAFSHQGRTVVQLFPMFSSLISGELSGLTSLFQNTVCWLLQCTPCENMDLAMSARNRNIEAITNNTWATEFILQHVGECVASGVYVDFAWSDHLVLGDFVSETGWQEPIPGGIRLHLGTISSASTHTFLVKLESTMNKVEFVTATVHAANGEAIQENNQSWSSNTVQETGSQLKAIMLPGHVPALILPSNLDTSTPMTLEWSRDLENWSSWEISTPKSVLLIPTQLLSDRASFYRLSP